MKDLFNCINAEYLKAKGTFTYKLIIIAAVIVPLFLFLIYLTKSNSFIPMIQADPWNNYFNSAFSITAKILFPFFIILLIALNFGIEHKENSWKKLLTLPINRTTLYYSKILFMLIQVVISLCVFLISLLIFGIILGTIIPDFKFLEFSFEFSKYLKTLSGLFIAILGILSIQSIISYYTKNMIIPITTGIFALIISNILALTWKYSYLIPYSYSSLYYYSYTNKLNTQLWFNMRPSQILSVVFFVALIIVGAILFRKKSIK